MNEFEAIAAEAVTEEFERLTKIVDSMTPDDRRAYADNFPVRIWTVAGLDENNSFAISVN